ncbi:MAG TPA: hypothetical protein VGI39_45070 [Polyangiaceae bacterium]|jgi:hypothetical protein
MRSVADVEAYLGRLNRRFDGVDGQEGTFLVRSSDRMPPIALRVDPPLVVFRVHIGDVKPADAISKDHVALFRKLLELNARALVHSSFGLEGDRIVLCAALELENLDFNEVQATLDEIDLTLAQQVPVLSELSKKNA